MSKNENYGSVENLMGARQSSRGSLFTSSSVDDILDKLKVLGYQKQFCLANNLNPIHRYYFQVADPNPNQQFFVFALLVSWLLGKLHVPGVQKPGQFDDPNAICASMAADLKKLGIPLEFGPTKLKTGFGEACIFVLQTLVDMALSHLKIEFGQPIHKMDDYPDEAEVDHDAEITTEKLEEVEANQDEDEMYTNTIQNGKKDEVKAEQVPQISKTDPAEWRLEVERVTPSLKVAKLANDNKDWRLHLQQVGHHHQKINGGMTSTQLHLKNLHSEIDQILEKISSREKYINGQFEKQIDQFKRLQDQSSDSKQKYSIASTNVTELTNELARISEELESIKSQMDDLGSGMTDSKPLMSIKQASTRLKTEIKQMDVRIGVIENTLLHAKLRVKGLGASSDTFSVQGTVY